MKWVFDVDGVITSNPDFFRWWIYQLQKKGNNNEVHILSARNPDRHKETIIELKRWGIRYFCIHTMLDGMERGLKNLGVWKVSKILEIKPDIWVENEVKAYKEVGVNFSVLPKKLNIINI